MLARWLLALALVLSFFQAPLLNSARAQEAEVNTDRMGSDYRRIEMQPSISGFASCQSQCEADGQCKAWTFVKSGVQGPKALCYLKNSVPQKAANNCCVSGIAFRAVAADRSAQCNVFTQHMVTLRQEAERNNCAFLKTGGWDAPASHYLNQCRAGASERGMQGNERTFRRLVDECKAAGGGTPGGGGTQTASLGSKVVAYASSNQGKCVDGRGTVRAPCPPLAMGRVGDGECTHLVQGALSSVGARFTPGSYVWGTKVSSSYQPGDIIQLKNVKLVGSDGWWETTTQHSAIIQSVNGNVLTVLEQNTWADNNKTNRRYVTSGTINLNWTLARGTIAVYRPTK